MDLYADNILDHYRNPRQKGALSDADLSHREINASCGDDLTVHLKKNDGDKVTLQWEGNGCAISQAAISMIADELSGHSLKELETLSTKNVYEMLGVPIGARRTKCALLGLHAIKNALHLMRNENAQSWTETLKKLTM